MIFYLVVLIISVVYNKIPSMERGMFNSNKLAFMQLRSTQTSDSLEWKSLVILINS